LSGGLNTYGYVASAPLIWSDSFGLAKAPTDAAGNPLPPPVPLPPGKGGQANSWVPVPGSGTGDRGTKWKPRYPVPSPGGGQPGASWDEPGNHWDVDNGQGQRDRYDPQGNRVDHDGNKTCDNDCKAKVIGTVGVGALLWQIVQICSRIVWILVLP
jgi:hypothetical protein